MLCRVYKKLDGSVAVLRPNEKMRRVGESDADFLNRIAAKDAPNSGLENLPFIDIAPTALPPRKDRKEWDVDIDKKEVKVKAK